MNPSSTNSSDSSRRNERNWVHKRKWGSNIIYSVSSQCGRSPRIMTLATCHMMDTEQPSVCVTDSSWSLPALYDLTPKRPHGANWVLTRASVHCRDDWWMCWEQWRTVPPHLVDTRDSLGFKRVGVSCNVLYSGGAAMVGCKESLRSAVSVSASLARIR
jgi:hypothetical protein